MPSPGPDAYPYGLERPQDPRFEEKEFPPTTFCAWCAAVNTHDTQIARDQIMTNRVAVGEWDGRPVCLEHAIFFEKEYPNIGDSVRMVPF